MATFQDCQRSDLKDTRAVRTHAKTCPKRGESVRKAFAKRDAQLANLKAAKIARREDEQQQQQLEQQQVHL